MVQFNAVVFKMVNAKNAPMNPFVSDYLISSVNSVYF